MWIEEVSTVSCYGGISMSTQQIAHTLTQKVVIYWIPEMISFSMAKNMAVTVFSVNG